MSDSNRSEAGTDAPAGWPTTRFAPGSATGLIGRRTIGLIEATDVTTRDRLWALVDADAAIDDILDELASQGLKSLPSFGIAEADGDVVRVVARGRVSVLAARSGADEREIDPSDVRTWTEEALTDVESVTMRIGDAGVHEGDDVEPGPYFVLAGIVPAAALVRRYAEVSAVASHDDVPAFVAPEGPTIEVATIPATPQPEQSESLSAEPASPFAEDDVEEPFVVEAPPSATTGRDLSGWAERPVLGVLAFSNGERIPVDGSVLVGRNPKFSGESDGSPLPRIMKFDGPNQGLSRTHAEIRVEGSDIVLEDLHSTNGTEIRLPGQQPERVEGGAPIVIVPGAQIDFGDELFCTLETADA